jgi:hypothetical protein
MRIGRLLQAILLCGVVLKESVTQVRIGFLIVFLLWIVDWHSKTHILSGGSLDALFRPLSLTKAQAI